MPIGAIIGAAGNLIGSFMNEQGNDRRHKESLQAQKEENQLNRAWQEQMWEEHESPQAQVQNMRAAGLNPMGQVSSQSVGTASTSSLPTPPPSTIGDGIARAGESFASNLHARKALKLQRDQFEQQVTEENRRFLMDLATQQLNAEQQRVLIDEKIEETRLKRLSADMEQINLDMLTKYRDAGGNTYQDASDLTQAQTAYTNAQKEYQELMGKIASEQNEEQKKVLRAQAESLKASAQQSYANAILASVQTEVAKSTKIKIDNDTQISKDQDTRAAALHELEIAEQKLINAGLDQDVVRKRIENARLKIKSGDVYTFGELGWCLFYNIDEILTFM